MEKYYEFDLNVFDLSTYLIKPHFDLLMSRVKFNEIPLANTHKHAGAPLSFSVETRSSDSAGGVSVVVADWHALVADIRCRSLACTYDGRTLVPWYD